MFLYIFNRNGVLENSFINQWNLSYPESSFRHELTPTSILFIIHLIENVHKTQGNFEQEKNGILKLNMYFW